MNKQDNNVGNKGDVIKHRLLVDTLKYCAKQYHEQHLVYIDTHAYAFQSAIPEKNHPYMIKRDGDDQYYKLEQPYLKERQYLCSPGLAFMASKDFISTSFLICEIQDENFNILKSKFKNNSLVVSQFSSISLDEILLDIANPFIYMLIDPFTYSTDKNAVKLPIITVANTQRPAIIQLFNFGSDIEMNLVPHGWSVFSCNKHPYYNVLMTNITIHNTEEISIIINTANNNL